MLETKILVFLEAAESGSVKQAAARLDLDPQEAAGLIGQLEQELNVQLFLVSASRLRLTRMGEKFYHGCKRIEEMVSNLKDEMNYIPVPKIAIGFSGTRDNQGVLELTSWYKQQNPSATFTYRKLSAANPLDELLDGGCDVCFALQNTPVSRKGLRSLRLFDYEVCTILSPDHPLAKKQTLEAGDLSNQNLIWLGRQYGESFYCSPLRVCSLPDGPSPFCKEVRSLEELLSCITGREGVGLASKSQIDSDAVEKAGLKTDSFFCPYCIWLCEDEARDEILDFANSALRFYDAASHAGSAAADAES